MKRCYLNRGLPGSGKSTRTKRLKKELEAQGHKVLVCSSDFYHECPCCGHYNFRVAVLGEAHKWCQEVFRQGIDDGVVVIVDNTNATVRECHPYVQYAVANGYEVVFLEPENPWAYDIDELLRRNVHNVPRDGLERMLSRWVGGMTVEKALAGEPVPGEMTRDEEAADGQVVK